VREQFKRNPGIMKGTSKPDYGECVDIATKAALGKMVLPGVLVVGMTSVGLLSRRCITPLTTARRSERAR